MLSSLDGCNFTEFKKSTPFHVEVVVVVVVVVVNCYHLGSHMP